MKNLKLKIQQLDMQIQGRIESIRQNKIQIKQKISYLKKSIFFYEIVVSGFAVGYWLASDKIPGNKSFNLLSKFKKLVKVPLV